MTILTDRTRAARLARLCLIVFVSCQIAVHYYGLLSREPAGAGATTSIFAANVGLLQGSSPTDPQQTRLITPVVLRAVSAALPLPSGYAAEKSSLVLVKFLSALFATAMFVKCADVALTTEAARLVAVLAFGLAALSSELDVGRLDALFGPGVFLAGIFLLLAGAQSKAAARRPVHVAAVLGCGALAASARFDLAMLVAGLGVLFGLIERRWDLVHAFVAQGVVAFGVFVGIALAFDVRGVVLGSIWSAPGVPRIAGAAQPGAWLTLALFFSVAAPVAVLALRDLPRVLRVVFWGTLGYGVFLMFVGNVSEYRLWLPLAAICVLASARFLEVRCFSQQPA